MTDALPTPIDDGAAERLHLPYHSFPTRMGDWPGRLISRLTPRTERIPL